MVVAGVPQINPRHICEIANLALDVMSEVTNFRIQHLPDTPLLVRVGIHTGPCAAGKIELWQKTLFL